MQRKKGFTPLQVLVAIVLGFILIGAAYYYFENRIAQQYSFGGSSYGAAPHEVLFTYNDPAPDHNYRINFGDGTSGSLQYVKHPSVAPGCLVPNAGGITNSVGCSNNTSYDYEVHHTYTTPGIYTATLKSGLWQIAKKIITVVKSAP